MYGTAWAVTQQPELVAFREWTERYRQAPAGASRAALEAEGFIVAQARRVVMRELMERDPQTALAVAVPAAVRITLPESVAAALESRVAGIGDYAVIAIDGVSTAAQPSDNLIRTVSLNGQHYSAHVYGRRSAQLTKEGVSLHGIVLDDHMALHESPLRVLDPGEASIGNPIALALVAGVLKTAPTLAEGSAIGFEAQGRQLLAADVAALDELEARLVAAEEVPGPKVAVLLIGNAAGVPVVMDAPATSWTTGIKRILVIRVDFSDRPGEPVHMNTGLPTSYDEWMEVMTNRVAPFYAEGSYGQAIVVSTVTPKIYRMPDTAAAYVASDYFYDFHDAATAVAASDYSMADYDVVAVAFSSLADIAPAGTKYRYAAAWAELGGTRMWLNGYFSFPTVAHELGHNYGLNHANLWRTTDGNPLSSTGTAVEYGDLFDMMGRAADPTHHFNEVYKNQLGWLPDRAVVDVAVSGTYRLYRFDMAGADLARPLALRLFRSGGQTFWMGYRKPEPVLGRTSVTPGLYVCWNWASSTSSQSLDLSPENDLTDVALPFGRTLLDSENGIAITATPPVGTGTDEYVDVSISITKPECLRSPVRSWGEYAPVDIPSGLTGITDLALSAGYGLALRDDGTVVAWGDNYSGCVSGASLLRDVAALAALQGTSAAVHRDGSVTLWGGWWGMSSVLPGDFPVSVRQVAFGYQHGLALRTDGTVYAWGDNRFGQCSVPSGLSNVVAIAATDSSSVALKDDGTVVQWGHWWTVPDGLSDVVAIAAGEAHVVALKRDGSVFVWAGYYTDCSQIPEGLSEVRAIASAWRAAYALRADGSLIAWGRGWSGGPPPMPLTSLPAITKICVDASSGLALVNSGAPAMTVQPVDRTVDAGASVAFTAFAMAKPQPSYRWQSRDSVALAWGDMVDGGGASGTATPSLSITGLSGAASGRQFRCLVTNPLGSVTSRLATLRIDGVVPIAPRLAWRQHFFGTIANTGTAADSADPDADGRANLLEYAVGADPTSAASGAELTSGTANDAQGTHLTLTFSRIADPALSYTVEASNDLVSWATIWTSTGTGNVEGAVVVNDSTASQQTHPRRFLRLKVSY